MTTYRAVLTVEWSPSASIGEEDAVRQLLESTGHRLMESLVEWGVVDPCIELDHFTLVPDDGGDETGLLGEDEEE